MTVATGYAYLSSGHGMVGVLSDSRLSWIDGRYAEIAVKAHDLGSRIAVVSAGLGIVGPYAAELTRSIIDTSAARPNEPTISLWDATRTFAYFAREVQREIRAAHNGAANSPAENEFVMAGFFSDGSPGVAYIALSEHVERVQFWRPGPNQLACFTIGASPAKQIVNAAYADYQPGAGFSDWNEAVASAMLYAMRAEGETFRSIGGGLAMGICTMQHSRFVWPAVEVDGERFFRGFRVPSPHTTTGQNNVLKLRVDTNYAAELDRRVEDAKHGKGAHLKQSRTYECVLSDLLSISPFRRLPEPNELQTALR